MWGKLLVAVVLVSACAASLVYALTPDAARTARLQVEKRDLELRPTLGRWFYQGVPFEGDALTHHSNGEVADRIPYAAGKKQGVFESWYADGALRKRGHYARNKLHGTVSVWSPSGVLVSESNYVNGVTHGVQRSWYADGQLFKVRNLQQGKEHGIQQAFRHNGKLYVNYEARHGRTFGLKRSTLCYSLEDEVVQY